MRTEKQKRNRRYYIHRKLKGIYTIQPRKKLIQIPAGEEIKRLSMVMELIIGGYSAQYYIR